jgi:hypothetical protein
MAFGFSPPDGPYFATRLRNGLGERGAGPAGQGPSGGNAPGKLRIRSTSDAQTTPPYPSLTTQHNQDAGLLAAVSVRLPLRQLYTAAPRDRPGSSSLH